MKKIIVPIKGMHCRSCELLLEGSLGEMRQVETVKVNHKTGQAEIGYLGESQPSLNEISKVVKELGYEVGVTEKAQWFSRDFNDYRELLIAIIVILVIYLVGSFSGLFNLDITNMVSSANWGVAILVGLTAGFSTCLALVGGLVLSAAANYAKDHPEATARQKFMPHLIFNFGRIIGFAFLGGLLGIVGSVFRLSSTTTGLLTMAIGAVMLFMGLKLINVFPRLSSWQFSLPAGISRGLGLHKKDGKKYHPARAAWLGAATFFLPCGFTQAMQVYAMASGSFWTGALTMGLFAIGTAPGLLGVAGISAAAKGSKAKIFFKAAGVAVVLFGLFNFNNGLTLFKLNNFQASANSNSVNSTAVSADPNVSLENGVQVVKMAETGQGYSPNKFTITKGVPVRWVIDAQAPYSCASGLVVPSLSINKQLVAGENVIEFTPSAVGTINFSCSMGMYTGSFNVVDANSPTSVNNTNQPVAVASSGSGGSCGASGGGGGSTSLTTGGCGCGGGGKAVTPNSGAVNQTANEQVIKADFTVGTDIQPNTFKVKVNQPVRFVVNAKEDGQGCMSAITIPGLFDQAIPIRAGAPLEMAFTPTKPGSYQITCAMGVPRGTILVE